MTNVSERAAFFPLRGCATRFGRVNLLPQEKKRESYTAVMGRRPCSCWLLTRSGEVVLLDDDDDDDRGKSSTTRRRRRQRQHGGTTANRREASAATTSPLLQCSGLRSSTITVCRWLLHLLVVFVLVIIILFYFFWFLCCLLEPAVVLLAVVLVVVVRTCRPIATIASRGASLFRVQRWRRQQ
jgi:hypothetical protein